MTCRTVIDTDYPVLETVRRCIELAESVPEGTATVIDQATLVCHLRVLRDDFELTAQDA